VEGPAPAFDPEETYQLLRNLTSPLVAITAAAGTERNGMIADSAIRASLAPRHPRVGFFCHKFNHTHDLIARAGGFTMHLLRDDQWELIHRLGFVSGRDGDKLRGLELETGVTGCPILLDCHSAFECRVANRMDAGASTFQLGEIASVRRGTGERVMTAAYFRANMPPAWRPEYESNLKRAQAYADAHGRIGG
jgi:flavin reductase (DIM6/NTAB) family NADH-FMN oxidoreductase RutF